MKLKTLFQILGIATLSLAIFVISTNIASAVADTTAPSISIVSPILTNNNYITKEATLPTSALAVKITDVGGIATSTVIWNNNTNNTAGNLNSTPYGWLLNAPITLNVGINTITVRANDMTGNAGTKNFTITRTGATSTPPTTDTTAPPPLPDFLPTPIVPGIRPADPQPSPLVINNCVELKSSASVYTDFANGSGLVAGTRNPQPAGSVGVLMEKSPSLIDGQWRWKINYDTGVDGWSPVGTAPDSVLNRIACSNHIYPNQPGRPAFVEYPLPSISVAGYNAEVVSHNIPSTMSPGETYNINVVFRNTGTKTWANDGSISMRTSPFLSQIVDWVPYNSSTPTASELLTRTGDSPYTFTAIKNLNTKLPNPVAPGGVVTLPVTVRAPATGIYPLEFYLNADDRALNYNSGNRVSRIGNPSARLLVKVGNPDGVADVGIQIYNKVSKVYDKMWLPYDAPTITSGGCPPKSQKIDALDVYKGRYGQLTSHAKVIRIVGEEIKQICNIVDLPLPRKLNIAYSQGWAIPDGDWRADGSFNVIPPPQSGQQYARCIGDGTGDDEDGKCGAHYYSSINRTGMIPVTGNYISFFKNLGSRKNILGIVAVSSAEGFSWPGQVHRYYTGTIMQGDRVRTNKEIDIPGGGGEQPIKIPAGTELIVGGRSEILGGGQMSPYYGPTYPSLELYHPGQTATARINRLNDPNGKWFVPVKVVANGLEKIRYVNHLDLETIVYDWAESYKVPVLGINTTPILGQKGSFDSASCSVLTGWSCVSKTISYAESNIELNFVSVYVGGPMGIGKLAGIYKADLTRETAVGVICSAGNKNETVAGSNLAHGFSIPTPEIAKTGTPQSIYLYGINPSKTLSQNFAKTILIPGSEKIITCPMSTATPSVATSTTSTSTTSTSNPSGLTIGDRIKIITTSSRVVRNTAGANTTASKLGRQPSGSTGTIVSGPERKRVYNSPYDWFNINFDTGADGWISAFKIGTNNQITTRIIEKTSSSSSTSTADITPPVISIIFPALTNNATTTQVNNLPYIIADIRDTGSGIDASRTIWRNTTNNTTGALKPGYGWLGGRINLATGSNTITVTARDRAGNTTTKTFTVIYNTH